MSETITILTNRFSGSQLLSLSDKAFRESFFQHTLPLTCLMKKKRIRPGIRLTHTQQTLEGNIVKKSNGFGRLFPDLSSLVIVRFHNNLVSLFVSFCSSCVFCLICTPIHRLLGTFVILATVFTEMRESLHSLASYFL